MPAMQQQSENCKRAYTRIFSLRNSLCGCSRIEGTTATTLQCLLLTQTGHDLRQEVQEHVGTATPEETGRQERYWSKPECGRIFSHDSTAATEAAGVPR